MKQAIKLEVFAGHGDNLCRLIRRISSDVEKKLPIDYQSPRPWVAEIIGRSDKFGLERRFLSFNTDYSQANSCGSRGVIRLYILESGKVYEVFERLSWRRSDRYFCCVLSDGSINRTSKAEVEQWLESRG